MKFRPSVVAVYLSTHHIDAALFEPRRVVQHDTSLSTVGNIMKDEEQPRVDTVFKERRIRPFRKESMDDGVDMKEGHVKESNEVMGVLSPKFEASVGGVSNPDNTHHHVERRLATRVFVVTSEFPPWVASDSDFSSPTWNSVQDGGLLRAPRTTCPTEKSIKCEDGYAVSVGGEIFDNGTTCEQACDGKCCVAGYVDYTDLGYFGGKFEGNYPACDGLTANICKDGITCSGGLSCANATVGTIYQGCNAELGCWKAGFQGHVGSIIGSCNNAKVGCLQIASYGGYVNEIIGSCNNGYQNCGLNARGGYGYVGGNITSIRNSCNNGTYTCANAAFGGGYVLSIEDSCNKDLGCSSIARFGGSIDGGIKSSCNERGSCKLAGTLSCDGCYFNSSGIINSTIDDCCNCPYECYAANETTLPESCQADVPAPATCAPTFAPTSSPTFSNKGANKGKYDKGNAKGGENGKGFGVGKDPKACSTIKKENKCERVESCKWEDGKCSDNKEGGLGAGMIFDASASENVEDPMKMQPNSAAAVPQVASATKVSAAVLAAFVMMWFGN